MPRALKFKYGESEFECDLNKIDRRKLYGSIDIETVSYTHLTLPTNREV